MRRFLKPKPKLVTLLAMLQFSVFTVYHLTSVSYEQDLPRAVKRDLTLRDFPFLDSVDTQTDSDSQQGLAILHSQRKTSALVMTNRQTILKTFRVANVFSTSFLLNDSKSLRPTKNNTLYKRVSDDDESNAETNQNRIKATQTHSSRKAAGVDSRLREAGNIVATADLQDPRSRQTTLAQTTLSKAASGIKCKPVSLANDFSVLKYLKLARLNTSRIMPRLLLSPKRVCSTYNNSQGSPFLMVLIMSSYRKNSPKERRAIRATYGSVIRDSQSTGNNSAMSVRMVFVLGRPPTVLARKQILAEVGKFGDLLVADFRDTYRNLTLKVLRGLQWVLDDCPHTSFILKADEDTFVNLPLLTTFLSQRGQGNSLYGKSNRHNRVLRKGRWSVARNNFPFLRYPLYMCGTGYVLSMDAAGKVVGASLSLQFIPVEDAFIGIVATVTKIRRIFCSGFTRYVVNVSGPCKLVLNKRFIANEISAADKYVLWSNIRHNSSLC